MLQLMDVLGSGKYLALRLHGKRSAHFLEESESTEWEYSWFWGFRFQPMMRTSYCIVRLSEEDIAYSLNFTSSLFTFCKTFGRISFAD